MQPPASAPARRFIILCAARTGSTMLKHFLHSHPDIWCHGEVFGDEVHGFVGVGFRSPLRPVLKSIRSERPREFLHDFVFAPEAARAVGFKIKYEELSQPELRWLLDELRAEPDLHVIHLFRQNRLKRFVSWYLSARVHHIMNITNEKDRPARTTIRVSPRECLDDFAATARLEAQFLDWFAGKPSITTTYEALLADPAELPRIVAFLGVDPFAVQTKTLKMNSDNLRDLVENYDELAAALAGTEFAHYLR